ncbi:24987_t:CDS:2, partial [Gigaspora margarita]
IPSLGTRFEEFCEELLIRMLRQFGAAVKRIGASWPAVKAVERSSRFSRIPISSVLFISLIKMYFEAFVRYINESSQALGITSQDVETIWCCIKTNQLKARRGQLFKQLNVLLGFQGSRKVEMVAETLSSEYANLERSCNAKRILIKT